MPPMALTEDGFQDLKAIVLMVIGVFGGLVRFVQWELTDAASLVALGGLMAGAGLLSWRDRS